MEHVIIGVDPHKLSATIEVVDHQERRLGLGRFTTDKAGFAAMRTYAKPWPHRVWAVEGANGVGRSLAQRLLEAGEDVLDVPAKLAARARLLDPGTAARPTPGEQVDGSPGRAPPEQSSRCHRPTTRSTCSRLPTEGESARADTVTNRVLGPRSTWAPT